MRLICRWSDCAKGGNIGAGSHFPAPPFLFAETGFSPKIKTLLRRAGTAYRQFPAFSVFVLLHFRQTGQGQQDREHEAECAGAQRRKPVHISEHNSAGADVGDHSYSFFTQFSNHACNIVIQCKLRINISCLVPGAGKEVLTKLQRNLCVVCWVIIE